MMLWYCKIRTMYHKSIYEQMNQAQRLIVNLKGITFELLNFYDRTQYTCTLPVRDILTAIVSALGPKLRTVDTICRLFFSSEWSHRRVSRSQEIYIQRCPTTALKCGRCICSSAVETSVIFQGDMDILTYRSCSIWIRNFVRNTRGIMQIFSSLNIWNGWHNTHISQHDSCKRILENICLYSRTPFPRSIEISRC